MNEIKVISASVDYGYAVVMVDPFEATIHDGRTVVIDSFFAWIENKGQYPEPRGRVIKKDGQLGLRRQAWFDVPVPQFIADALERLAVNVSA